MIQGKEPSTLEEAMARKNIAKLKDLAIRVGCSPRSLSSWLSGDHQPSPYYLGRLTHILGTDASRFFPARAQQATGMTRRSFIVGAGTIPLVTAILPTFPARGTFDLAPGIIQSLDVITQQYRTLQRNGALGIEDGLRGHIATLGQMLELTVNDRSRRELWRLLAQAQLIARLSITKEHELARAKTWNEAAIASAQQSGDAALLAAAIGHLGHLYLMWQHDTGLAGELITEARQRTQRNTALRGWLALISAAVASKEDGRDGCERAIAEVDDTIAGMSSSEQGGDAFFTDFSPASADAFVGNSLMGIGEAEAAYKRLAGIDLGRLSHNRHASTFYDISRAYVAAGELEAAQVYAVQAIDNALATNRLYIVPRFLTLAAAISHRDPGDPQARAIAEYARSSLQQR